MHPMLNTAVKAARRAGAIINRASLDLDLVQVTRKSHNDYVTEVDKGAEAAVIETLLSAYPDHSILAEESGMTRGKGQAPRTEGEAPPDFLWVIDPLDGTTNFIHGFPQYCVSIALAQRGQVTQAVVYDPTRNDLFTASKGRGAFLNDRRIRVSKRAKLGEALLGTGFPSREFDRLEAYLRMFRLMTVDSAGVRRPGAAALDLAYVAAGRLDGFFEMGLKPWDIAAGSLLVTEAGGLVGDFQGNSDYMHSGDVLAAAPKIFGHLVQQLGPLHQGGTAAPAPVQS
jgi:myo-inositol-1(or 4)-monophosphatase